MDVQLTPSLLTSTAIEPKLAAPTGRWYTVMSAPGAFVTRTAGSTSPRSPRLSVKSGTPLAKSVTKDFLFGKPSASTGANVFCRVLSR